MRMTEGERHVLELLWARGELSATELADTLQATVGWKRTTAYTMIDRCIKKGYLRRSEPGFRCVALLSREEVARAETEELLQKNYSGSADLLVAALAGQHRLSRKQMALIYQTLCELEEQE